MVSQRRAGRPLRLVEGLGPAVVSEKNAVQRQPARGGGIQVVARAAEILRLLQAHPGGLSQVQIGERSGLLDQVVSPRRLRAISAVGESFPLHCCANRKALLAALPPAREAEAMPGRLSRLTARTIRNPQLLRRELAHIGLEGIAFDREEQAEGVCAMAAVLRGATPHLAAVSVPVPAQRFYGRERELARALRAWVATVNAWCENAGAAEGNPASWEPHR